MTYCWICTKIQFSPMQMTLSSFLVIIHGHLCRKKMNKFLDKIANWLAFNKLSLNTNKTIYITVENYCDSVPRKIEIEIHKQKTKRVTDYKYLGIIFDFNMKWNKHMSNSVELLTFTVL